MTLILTCVCCQSTDIKTLDFKSFFKIPVNKCQECGHTFSILDNLGTYYSEKYWQEFKSGKLGSIRKIINLSGVKFSRASSHYRYFKHWIGGG